MNDRIIAAYAKGYRATDCGKVLGPTGNELKLCPGANGYLVFGIRLKGKSVTVPVHRFVAYSTFGQDALSAECVRHLDGDKHNNAKSNLVPGSLSENFADNNSEWKEQFAKRGAETKRKLSPGQVSEIKEGLASGRSLRDLADTYGVCKSSIQQIKEGKSYAWVI